VNVTATKTAQVGVLLAPSTAGLANVRIRARGKLVARSTIAVSGENRYGVNLTRAGLGVLRRHPRLRVRATIRFRDIFGAAAPVRRAGGVVRLGRVRCPRC